VLVAWHLQEVESASVASDCARSSKWVFLSSMEHVSRCSLRSWYRFVVVGNGFRFQQRGQNIGGSLVGGAVLARCGHLVG
jgi:hypothetical protein